ncbi:helix-turn-helix domain-containing protein [Aeromicrobium fastidiosum]|uniref:Helix-turn-helix domain-containing protein n=1 Tax=Aeromicrobium fastidiosum TaxID=52699 RepID=A0A641ARY4_9ACTN|nr:XRE family transcriptional regulator [Aeromicrobium fastidiosum]KAA1380705.1 helix-turn-helix domain-containing protein [Aeromicrobium fastidiosum]MBP2390319.1 transcriptional regulator with XRE-family HTH domain [Aeromicrobium fastidiosum]
MIGTRLRELRTAQGLTLRALAEEIDVSPTLISQVERGVAEPSLKTLRSLATFFGTSVSTLFDDGEDLPGVHLSLPGERSRISSPSGHIQYERIAQGRGQLEVLIGVLGPGDTSSDEAWAHEAVECAYVLTGTLTVEVGRATHEVPVGAAISFDSNQPHRYLNRGSEQVRFILSATPPTP